MRVTVIQCAPGTDKQANIRMVSDLMRSAVEQDRPDLVSLPEMWTCLGGDRETKLSQGECLPEPGGAAAEGSAYRFLSEFARTHLITVHGGSLGERQRDGLFNTTVVFGPDGSELGRYRKIHLFDVTIPGGADYRESRLFGAGDAPTCCDTGVANATMRLGLSICYDLRFPELFIALRRAGATVIMVPSAFTKETGRDHWEVLLRARAIETQCWVVAAATTGRHEDGQGGPRETFGHSLICDPWGHVVVKLEAEPGFATATLDAESFSKVRTAMPVFEHRRLI